MRQSWEHNRNRRALLFPLTVKEFPLLRYLKENMHIHSVLCIINNIKLIKKKTCQINASIGGYIVFTTLSFGTNYSENIEIHTVET